MVSDAQLVREYTLTGKIATPGFQAGWGLNLDGTPGHRVDIMKCGTDCPCGPGCRGCVGFRLRAAGVLTEPVQLLPNYTKNLWVPFGWKSPGKVCAICLEGDLFHDNISDSAACQVFAMVESLPQHRFVVLTKRADRMHRLLTNIQFPMMVYDAGVELFGEHYRNRGNKMGDNLVVGVSVENQDYIQRAEVLADLPKTMTTAIFVAPMLGPVDISKVAPFTQWVSCSPERGSKWCDPRPCEEEWILNLRDQCVHAGIPFWLDKLYRKEWVNRFSGTWKQRPAVLTA